MLKLGVFEKRGIVSFDLGVLIIFRMFFTRALGFISNFPGDWCLLILTSGL